MRVCRRGAHILKRLIYAIPLSAIAVLVFAAIAVAQDVPTGQQQGQEPSPTATGTNTATDTNSTSLKKRIRPRQDKRNLLRAAHPPLTAQRRRWISTPSPSTRTSSTLLQARQSSSKIRTLWRTPLRQTTRYSTQIS